RLAIGRQKSQLWDVPGPSRFLPDRRGRNTPAGAALRSRRLAASQRVNFGSREPPFTPDAESRDTALSCCVADDIFAEVQPRRSLWDIVGRPLVQFGHKPSPFKS